MPSIPKKPKKSSTKSGQVEDNPDTLTPEEEARLNAIRQQRRQGKKGKG